MLRTLPTELLSAILLELNPESIARCRQVCKFIHSVIDNSASLQYKILLRLTGMEDGPPSTISSATRLQNLMAQQAAWRKQAWSSEKNIQLPDGNSWELTGGVFAMATGDPGTGIMFVQVPSVHRGIEEKEWKIEDMGFIVRDFCMDPSQNLLVAIEAAPTTTTPTQSGVFKIHIRSLSDGRPHPLAAHPVLTYGPMSSDRPDIFNMHLFGTHVSIRFECLPHSPSLPIWNWRTGEMIKHICGHQMQGMSFLTENLALVGFWDDSDETMNSITRGQISLEVIDLTNETSSEPIEIEMLQSHSTCSFRYPPSPGSFESPFMHIYSEPPSHGSLPVPFRTSSDDRLFVITHECWYFMETVTRREFVLLVPLSSLLPKVLDIMSRGTSESPADRVIPWADWGPHGTRMMDRALIQLSDIWVCYVHGMKVIGQLPRIRNRNRAVIYDFDVVYGDIDSDTDEPLLHSEDLLFDVDCDLFSTEVVTRRPYRVTVFNVPPVPDGRRYDGIMISEDAILTVSKNSQMGILSF